MSHLFNLLVVKSVPGKLALSLFVLSILCVLVGTSANRSVNADNDSQSIFGAPWVKPSETRSVQSTKGMRMSVDAVNGEAFMIRENMAGTKFVPLKTSMPVFKAFDLSADRRTLLYSPLKKGMPSGELYLEDLSTQDHVKITSRLVLTASRSPVDDNLVAYTFATGGGFGLALLRLASHEEIILASSNVFTENIQWNDSGTGINYFKTGDAEASDNNIVLKGKPGAVFDDYVLWDNAKGSAEKVKSTLTLNPVFQAVDDPAAEKSVRDVPFGFPTLDARSGANSDIKRPSNDNLESTKNPFSFHLIAPDGLHEVTGDNMLGADALSSRTMSNESIVDLGTGQLIKVLRNGVLTRRFSPSGTQLQFVDWNGKATLVGLSAVSHNLPLLNSVMIQGGTGYAGPGNCNITAHTGALQYAYDFQTQVVGTHALASADGLVVYTESSVTCNTIDTTSCTDYNAGGCSGSYLGNIVIVQLADGTFSKYAHMETGSPQVVVGTNVNQGLYIGRQGHTGSTAGVFNGCGDHLHFQVQSSPDIFGQSVPVDFADVAVEPLSCGTTYASASSEISHSISPSSQNFGISGGTGVVNVTSTGGAWSATSNDGWITITFAGTGTGNSTVDYTVANNSAGGARTGSMYIGGHIFLVSQSGGGVSNQSPIVNAGSDQTITLPSGAMLGGTATDDGLPNPPAILTTTWSKVSGPGSVTFGNANALNTMSNFGLAGIYFLRLTADDGSISVSDDVKVVVNTNSGGGFLIGNQNPTSSNVSLSTEGTLDWAHWGLSTSSSFNHKSGVTQKISDITQVGPVMQLRYTNSSSAFSWSGGTPTSSASNTTTGIYLYDIGNGFQLTVPADTTSRTLKLYVGLWNSGGRLEASMSDGSASPYIDTSLISTQVLDGVYTFNYQAASIGQTLTVRWTLDSNTNPLGNVTLQAASLKVYTPPTNQVPLVNAGSDQTVTLPGGASLAGTSTDDGLPNPPATLTTAWSQVSGPGIVTFGNANALSTTAGFSTAGVYVLRLSGNDSALSATDDVTITVNTAGGTGVLSVNSASAPANTNLRVEGTLDWAHWGLTAVSSFNHKSGATQQIGNYTVLGSGAIQRYTNNPNFYSWTGGTPTASATNTATGLYVIGQNNGFQITVPADTTQRTLKVYVGLWAAGGRFEASLSDGSAATYVDTSLLNSSSTSNGVYTVTYRAASSGKTLTVKWTVNTTFNQWSNITLQAATLGP